VGKGGDEEGCGFEDMQDHALADSHGGYSRPCSLSKYM